MSLVLEHRVRNIFFLLLLLLLLLLYSAFTILLSLLSFSYIELWALRSLQHEIFQDGAGGGDPWLQEHLLSGYKAAWHQPLPDDSVDAAIMTTGLSRWHNYYIEGLRWLLENVGVDGLYVDGIG